MKKSLYALIIMGLVFASCNKEQPKTMTKEEMKQKVDSLTRIQVEMSNDNARKDLERRIKIEVKVKVDSILNAQAHPKAKDAAPKRTSLFK